MKTSPTKTKKLLIIGHRGARGLAPENSRAALDKALEYEVDEIEFDIRITKDNVAVLIHDAVAHDAAGNALPIRDRSYAELLVHLPHLLTLEEALNHIAARVHLDIELKPGEPTGPVLEVISQQLASGACQPSDLSFVSFSYKTLRELHAALPEIPIIVNERWSGAVATWRARRLGTKRITMRSWWLWRGFISPLAKRGWQLSAYNVNNPKLAKKWAAYGLYGIVTDYPDRF